MITLVMVFMNVAQLSPVLQAPEADWTQPLQQPLKEGETSHE